LGGKGLETQSLGERLNSFKIKIQLNLKKANVLPKKAKSAKNPVLLLAQISITFFRPGPGFFFFFSCGIRNVVIVSLGGSFFFFFFLGCGICLTG